MSGKRKTVKVTRSTPQSNIPILVAASVTVSNGVATIGFADTTMGVFSRFHGIFAIDINGVIANLGASKNNIAVSEIYGEARELRINSSTVATVADLGDSGFILCSYDTEEENLYAVLQQQKSNYVNRSLGADLALSSANQSYNITGIDLTITQSGSYYVTAQIQLKSKSPAKVTAMIQKDNVVYSSCISDVGGCTQLYISAIVSCQTEDKILFLVMSDTADTVSVAYQSSSYGNATQATAIKVA